MTLDPKALDALRWYADPERWEACGSIQSPGAHPLLESAAAADLGRRAREALAALDRDPLVEAAREARDSMRNMAIYPMTVQPHRLRDLAAKLGAALGEGDGS
jgi:hypothetical protein